MKKKIFIVLTTLVICAAMIVAFAGCDGVINFNNNNNNTTSEKSANLVAVSATSSALILDEMQNSEIAMANADAPQKGATLTDEEIEEVKAQLKVLENYMGENAPVITEKVLASGDEYYGEYQYSMTIVTKDMHGNPYEYTMYFNQEKLSEKTEYDKDDDDHKGQLASGVQDFEFEEEFKLSGILVSGENVYELEGIKENETEVDDGETESESSYKMVIRKSDNEYVVFEQSIEEEGNESEQKFEYKVYADNKLVKEFSLEFENEFGESEVEMETRENGNTFRVGYESEIVNGKERIKAEVMKDGKICEVYITVEGKGTEDDPYRHIYRYGDIEKEDYDD